jgi:hypothetical protein
MAVEFRRNMWKCPVCLRWRRIKERIKDTGGRKRITRCCKRKFEITDAFEERIEYDLVIADVEEL